MKITLLLFIFAAFLFVFLLTEIRDLWYADTGPKCNTTVISAYYKGPSKHSYEEYLAWMANSLTIQDCLVLFVDPEQEHTMRSLRPASYPTLIIPRVIESFLISTMVSSEEWDKQEQMDHERGVGHNRMLYSVWNEKTNFMKIVADMNPFSSSYFVWHDIGSMRHSGYNHQLLVRRRPQEAGCLMLNIAPYTEKEKELTDGRSLADFTHKDRVGATTICCDRDSLDTWHEAYYRTVRNHLAEGRFVGKEQNNMATTCLETNVCLLVTSGDWFRLQPWLRGEVDDNYTRMDLNHQ